MSLDKILAGTVASPVGVKVEKRGNTPDSGSFLVRLKKPKLLSVEPTERSTPLGTLTTQKEQDSRQHEANMKILSDIEFGLNLDPRAIRTTDERKPD